MIFDTREAILPHEYPALMGYMKAIHKSFWEADHFPYERDVRDFNIELTEIEKSALTRSMLAISIVENKVKTFWCKVPDRMNKSEISNVCFTFGANEVVHQQAYQRLLELLNLTDEFDKVFDVPCVQGRVEYLNKYLAGVNSRSNKEFTKSLILFTALVENCSLFSQFLIVSSFSKYKNLMKNFSKVVTASMCDENLHGQFGSHLINIIRYENPSWFDQEMEDKIRRNIKKAYNAEVDMLDWIFEKGELDFLSKTEVHEFLKVRFNLSLTQIGYEPEYKVDEKLLLKTDYVNRMLKSPTDIDFFDGKSTEYSKGHSYESDNIW